jgi:hypothetical protein
MSVISSRDFHRNLSERGNPKPNTPLVLCCCVFRCGWWVFAPQKKNPPLPNRKNTAQKKETFEREETDLIVARAVVCFFGRGFCFANKNPSPQSATHSTHKRNLAERGHVA